MMVKRAYTVSITQIADGVVASTRIISLVQLLIDSIMPKMPPQTNGHNCMS